MNISIELTGETKTESFGMYHERVRNTQGLIINLGEKTYRTFVNLTDDLSIFSFREIKDENGNTVKASEQTLKVIIALLPEAIDTLDAKTETI